MKKAERKKLISSLDAYENAERYWREAVGTTCEMVKRYSGSIGYSPRPYYPSFC